MGISPGDCDADCRCHQRDATEAGGDVSATGADGECGNAGNVWSRTAGPSETSVTRLWDWQNAQHHQDQHQSCRHGSPVSTTLTPLYTTPHRALVSCLMSLFHCILALFIVIK